MKLMLNTRGRGLAFFMKAIPKIDHLGVLFRELRVEGIRCFNVVSRLHLNAPHRHIGVDAISHLSIVARETPTPIFSMFKFDSSWSKVSVISHGYRAISYHSLFNL